MAHNDAYHWPPELLDLLIELVPRLNRSKEGVLGFLRGAGVSEDLLAPHRHQLAADKSAVSKYKIVRVVLSRINEQGDAGLGVRREILKRTIESRTSPHCGRTTVSRPRGYKQACDDS